MSIAKQLYQLQEIDLEIESKEQALKELTSRLGESEALVSARRRLTEESKRLEDLKHRQLSLEWETDDLTSKIAPMEKDLYSGRIRNPKELANLQREVEELKAKRSGLEDRELEIMEQVELATKNSARINSEIKTMETEWQSQQQQLSAEIEQLKAALSELKTKQQDVSTRIETKCLELYQQLKKQKGQAVVRVVQGICRGCRISLPGAELQRARGGNLVQCSSCGRILFLD